MRTLRWLLISVVSVMLASPLSAGVHELLTATDNSADTTVPVTDLLMVTLTTNAGQGGNDATDALVSIGGTVAAADVASISVYYQALLVTTVTNPPSLTDVNIALAGNQKGNQDWTFFVSLNGSAAGKTFNLTVTSITGTDDAVLPFTTATRNANGAANNPPTSSAADLTGQDDPQYAGVQYQVTSVHSDPDGATDLDALHLRLDHDTATDIELSVAQGAAATGNATVVSGAAFLIGTPTYSKTEGTPTANDVTVTWTYTLDWDWVESTLIEYAVRATDDAAADSGFDATNIDILYENDLDLSGTLSVTGAVNGALTCGSTWVQGSESLTWTGLTVVYEGSAVSPADGDFDLQITDDDTGVWTQTTGAALNLVTTSDAATDPSDVHAVDIVGIPAGGSDVSVVSCEILVDAAVPETLVGVAASSPTSSSVTISWTAFGGGDTGAVGDSGFQTYRVYYDTSPGVTTASPVWDAGNDPTLAISTTATTTITGLASSQVYYFRIVGVDQAENEGDVAAATEVTDTTQAGANNPPTSSVADLSGQDDPQYAGVPYQVTSVYSDPDGAADLDALHLRLDHDTATDVELSVTQGAAATGNATVVSGAAFLIGTPTYSKTEGTPTANDVTVTWTYTLDWDWVESTLIEYAVRATDDAAADSGFDATNLDIQYENDLDLSGTLSVTGAVNGALTCGSTWVQGSESLTWTGLTVVYEGSAVSPADGDFDLQITDDDTGIWTQATGAALNLGTTSDAATDPSDVHAVDIVGIPAGGSDVSVVSCEILVDAAVPETLAGVAASSPTSSSVTISWTAFGGGDTGAVGDSGFQTYRVYYDTSPGVTTASPVWDAGNDPTLAISTAATTTITGLASSQVYYFRIVGVDQAENEGDVAAATEVTDTTLVGAGDTLTATANTPIEEGSPVAGTTGVVMQRFEVTTDNADDGSLQLISITIDDLGTAGAGDWAQLAVYVDVDETFAGSTLIGQGAFDGTSTVLALNEPGTAAARTVTFPTPKFLFVVYDIALGAGGTTMKSRVTDIDVAAGDTGVSGLALDSQEILILAAASDATTIGSNAAASSTCDEILVTGVLTGDDNDDGWTLVEYNTTNSFTGGQSTACAQLSGPSPRVCRVVDSAITPGTANWVRVTWVDPDGVNLGGNPNPQALQVNVQACDAVDNDAPTVLFLTPARGAVVSGLDRAKVQVYDANGMAAADPVQYRIDGGALQTDAVVNNNYATLAGCTQPECKVYEFDLDTTALTNGEHNLTVLAVDSAGNATELNWGFRVLNLGTRPGGSGQLLRRSSSSQLCVDCHNIPTHSSQTTSSKYGSWAFDCLTCHTPHNTKNIHLLRETIRTPNSGLRQIRFEVTTGAVASTATAGSASYVNEDNATRADGPCQVCHTRTQSAGGQARWRNADSGGNADTHYTSSSGTPCTDCHTHAGGFAGAGGGGCSGCHYGSSRVAAGRRDVEQDFLKGSHHVGAGGTFMGGQLTDFDCVVCHAEGTINAGETETTAAWHANGTIDLKDTDTWNDASPTSAMVYVYDKDDIANNGGVGGPGDWSSANQYWREWTSGVDEAGGATLPAKAGLDPFCLSCHDSDGALASRNQNVTEGCSAGGDASNPFCDGAISNEYDQQDRGAVIDIASRVSGSPPPQGTFSRHAIRGQSTSVYTAFQNIGGANDFSMYEGDPTAGQSLFTNMGSDESGNPVWNDTSVMGCGDCHTVDGANGASGNAHGSDSEYLLKDAAGGATEGNLAGLSYVCYRCHVSGRYQPPTGPLGTHTANSGDWQDKTALTGLTRRDDGKGSSIFGLACANCHGGSNYGTIHGTSETFGVGDDGGSGTRNAYRFMNGASLRYYDPNGWTGTAITCYTVNSGDTWGGCSQHDKASGGSLTKPLQRPLNY